MATERLAALEQLLDEQIAPLRGRYKEIGIRLTPPADVEIVPGESLLDPPTLTAAIARFGARIGTTDQRIAGVHWLGQLGYAVLPPIELAMTRGGIGLDAALPNLGIIERDGQPASILIRDMRSTVVLPERYNGALPLADVGRPVDSAAALRHHVLDGLFGGTFGPLVELIHGLTGVSRKVLWNQVAYEADLFFQVLVRLAPEERTPAWEEDRAALFEHDAWQPDPSTGVGPLYGPTRVVSIPDPDGGAPIARTFRSVCCLIYQVPTSHMCGACPLRIKRDAAAAKRTRAE
jgi:Ferric iron reductase FhuF-like transporter/FhuF 2Fe-2S C-terminal domain